MFDELSAKLDGALARFRSRGVLDEELITEGMREVRRALLEADVHYRVAKDFCARVAERARGKEITRSVSPAQQVIKIVHDELVDLLGGANAPLEESRQPPTVIALVGLQGSGKTTTAAKLAHRLAKRGRRPLLVAADVYRPAAIDQLETLARQLDLPVVADRDETQVERLAQAGIERARADKRNVVIIDTAGRLHIDDAMMDELDRVVRTVTPDELLLVADGMTFDLTLAASGTYTIEVGNDQVGVCQEAGTTDCSETGPFTYTESQVTLDSGEADSVTFNYDVSASSMTWVGAISSVPVTVTFDRR